MRLCFHGRGQRSCGRSAMGETENDRRDRERRLGLTTSGVSDVWEGNAMKRTTPPFRADHVGSLLRPQALKDARAKRVKGEISAADLTAIEDREIERVIKKQEDIGLQVATDGEFRRSWWQFDFYAGLAGVELYSTPGGIKFHGVETKAESVRDVGNAYRKAVHAFYDAGCRYLQLDDTAWSMLCSATERGHSKERGDNPDALPAHYARMINAAVAGRPDDMTVTMHSCRGNFRSTWIAEGGYDPVAERMFNDVNIDGFFLEWDTDRAGGLEPLRFVPKGEKIVVLGLVTSKSGTLEHKDVVKRRIEEAAKYVDIEQLALSPQC